MVCFMTISNIKEEIHVVIHHILNHHHIFHIIAIKLAFTFKRSC